MLRGFFISILRISKVTIELVELLIGDEYKILSPYAYHQTQSDSHLTKFLCSFYIIYLIYTFCTPILDP